MHDYFINMYGLLRSGSLAVITKYICESNSFVSPGPKIRQRLKKLFILAKTREKKNIMEFYSQLTVNQVLGKFQSSVIEYNTMRG